MKKIQLLILPATLLIAVGCSLNSGTSTSKDISIFNKLVDVFPGEGYDVASTLGTELTQIYDSGNTQILPSVGDQKLLVIPVQFTDFTCEKLAKGCNEIKKDIHSTFFGESSDTGWESVASYYHKSSYGNLSITGTVTDWYKINMTASKFASLKSYEDPTYYALRNAVSWVKNQLGSKLTEYDLNNDGYIDAVWLVYSLDYNTVNQDVFWAYTYWDQLKSNKKSPVASIYAWASYDFMNEGKYEKPDAHTFIHETGHLLGIDDYYSLDTDSNYGPAGQLDMMDFNIGDHNAFSKTILGWTNPYILKDNATINLRSSASSGDCIIIKNNWNGTAFDEYLIIEYYTPTQLNVIDSKNKYTKDTPLLFTESGLKIYHIDARLGLFKANSNKDAAFQEYVTSVSSSYNTYTYFAHSNSKKYSVDPNYKLLHLLESSGANTFLNGAAASNETLFKEGSSFGVNTFTNFRFNDGSYLNYNIFVDTIDEIATLSFVKL